MMKMRLICLGLSLICLISHTYAQTFICNSIAGYDTKPLTSAYQWEVTTDYQCLGRPAANCTYFISFCQPASMCFNEYSACQNASGATNVTIIGGYTNHIFYENESGPRGFYAKFATGPMQNISNTTVCTPSLKIQFNCNPNEEWLVPIDYNVTGVAPEPTDIEIAANDSCATIMTFDYPGACYKSNSSNTTTTILTTTSTIPTTTTNGMEPIKGISAGALFLIILFCSTLVYFIIGTSYNAFVKHRSGLNLLPQAQFWIGLPLHAIEGCRATLTCCSGSSKPSRATYESV